MGETMIYPKGKVRHQNLLTAYTDLPALLLTLKSEGFTGTIEMEFPGKSGILFIDSGEIINGEAKPEAGLRTLIGPEAIQYLLAFSNQKDGVLNIYQLSPEQVVLLASNLQHEVVYQRLSTDFTRFDRLLLKLKEEKHNGFVEVFNKDHQAMGVLILQDGEPAEMFTISDSGPSVFGRKSIPTFVERAVQEGAILNVYRRQGQIQEEPIIIEEEAESPEEPPQKEEPQKEQAPKEMSLNELIQIFQGVLSKAENFVDKSSQKGTFRRVFKKSLIEKSDQYPFLDPFGGEFDYREGTIVFSGRAEERDFSKGIGECLQVTLSHLEKELPKNKMFPLKLRTEIESSLEPYRETMKRLGVNSVLPSFLR